MEEVSSGHVMRSSQGVRYLFPPTWRLLRYLCPLQIPDRPPLKQQYTLELIPSTYSTASLASRTDYLVSDVRLSPVITPQTGTQNILIPRS